MFLSDQDNPATIDAALRSSVLAWASQLTIDSSSPQAVLADAKHLYAFLVANIDRGGVEQPADKYFVT